MKRNEVFQTNEFAFTINQDFSGESHSITEHLKCLGHYSCQFSINLECPNLIRLQIQESQVDCREAAVQINGDNMQRIATLVQRVMNTYFSSSSAIFCE